MASLKKDIKNNESINKLTSRSERRQVLHLEKNHNVVSTRPKEKQKGVYALNRLVLT